MDFQSALETFAEAWVAANTQTALTSEMQKGGCGDGLPTMVSREVPDKGIEVSKKAANNGTSEAEKLLQIRCLVAVIASPEKPSDSKPVEAVIAIPSRCLFHDVVQSALLSLGYSLQDAIGAKGAVQVDNWKPIPLQDVVDNAEATVQDVMGHMVGLATLRISVIRNTENASWTPENVRLTVIDLLKTMPQSTLAKLSPLTQPSISNLVNRRLRVSEKRCQEFGRWYADYVKQKDEVTQDGSNIRMTFDPKDELPLLRQWYSTVRCPTDEMLQDYASELNKGLIRFERPKVTPDKIKNWWKNERQREKRHRLYPKEKRKKLCLDSSPERAAEYANDEMIGNDLIVSGVIDSPVSMRGERSFESVVHGSPELPAAASSNPFMGSSAIPFLGIVQSSLQDLSSDVTGESQK